MYKNLKIPAIECLEKANYQRNINEVSAPTELFSVAQGSPHIIISPSIIDSYKKLLCDLQRSNSRYR